MIIERKIRDIHLTRRSKFCRGRPEDFAITLHQGQTSHIFCGKVISTESLTRIWNMWSYSYGNAKLSTSGYILCQKTFSMKCIELMFKISNKQQQSFPTFLNTRYGIVLPFYTKKEIGYSLFRSYKMLRLIYQYTTITCVFLIYY